jgi:CheY-like chemotaxis protein
MIWTADSTGRCDLLSTLHDISILNKPLAQPHSRSYHLGIHRKPSIPKLTHKEYPLRLVVLMIEVEQPEGVSTRKLVLETARHNVITAYNTQTGIELLRRFPNVDVVVVHTEMQNVAHTKMENVSFDHTVRELKKIRSDIPIIGITPRTGKDTDGADYMLSSHDPQALLHLLAEHFEASLSDTDEE